ncbi:hypothetical protein GGC64_006276 [Mycobacterium sp. OAS707]|uniref:hypothetical protein n=1 Tax=Mycobacterium sp. OAS707 TaxID=2663822 RepID=UPI00178AA25C|nr:hypothetical protein [Mycobacterium sp. OAS707]MBE1552189.1 hypothetical protein [Mycobacterium sp. OAS707]
MHDVVVVDDADLCPLTDGKECVQKSSMVIANGPGCGGGGGRPTLDELVNAGEWAALWFVSRSPQPADTTSIATMALRAAVATAPPRRRHSDAGNDQSGCPPAVLSRETTAGYITNRFPARL